MCPFSTIIGQVFTGITHGSPAAAPVRISKVPTCSGIPLVCRKPCLRRASNWREACVINGKKLSPRRNTLMGRRPEISTLKPFPVLTSAIFTRNVKFFFLTCITPNLIPSFWKDEFFKESDNAFQSMVSWCSAALTNGAFRSEKRLHRNRWHGWHLHRDETGHKARQLHMS